MGALTASGPDGAVADPRTAVLQFDILYERLRALPHRPSYVNLLDDALRADLDRIRLAFERELPAIDRAGGGEISALVGARARLEPWRTVIERVAHRPAQIASERREAARGSLHRLSLWLVGVIALFIIAGLGFVGLILRQMRGAERRERDLGESRDALHQARELLSDALDSISEGFAVWDANDRLVMCNARYRDFHANLDGDLTPGVQFEECMRKALERGVYPIAERDLEAELERWRERRRSSPSQFEQQLSDGRWLEVNERRTRSGNTVATLSDITEKVASNETIRRLAEEDAMTGLPNRVTFQGRLQGALAHARRTDGRVGVMLIDLDRFKTVNDTLGHAAGDALLRAVGARLRECVRATDGVARLGGDEFGVVVTHPEDVASVARVARRIIEALSLPIRIDGRDIYSGASIGVTIFPDDDPGDVSQLLRNADLALYQAKTDGRGASDCSTRRCTRRFRRRARSNPISGRRSRAASCTCATSRRSTSPPARSSGPRR